MIGKNLIVKNSEKFSESNAKTCPENSIPLPRNRKKYLLSYKYDVNDHVYFKSKSISLRISLKSKLNSS